MPKTICIVENDELVRLDAVLILQEAGFQVVDFATVDEALAFIDEHATAMMMMIFTDVNTPGERDGVSLAQIVAISWPWVQILVTSGSDLPNRCLPPKSSFLPKPWRPVELLAHAAAAMEALPERNVR